MDDFFSPSEPTASTDADDFLRREREALGDSFSAPTGGSNGGVHDFEASASAFPDLDDEDGLGGFVSSAPPAAAAAPAFGAQVSVTGTNEFAAFENDYPELDETPAPDRKSVV